MTTMNIPLHEKEALSYEEVQALGYCSKRLLRKLVLLGQVKRAVLRAGRTVRFLRSVLIEELQQRRGRR